MAIQKYEQFVNEGIGRNTPWKNLKNQMYLGSDSFVNDMQKKLSMIKNVSISLIPIICL